MNTLLRLEWVQKAGSKKVSTPALVKLGVGLSESLNRIEVAIVECEGTYLCWILRRFVER